MIKETFISQVLPLTIEENWGAVLAYSILLVIAMTIKPYNDVSRTSL